MPRATGVRSLFSSLHPHELKEDLVHTPERNGSSKEFFSHSSRKLIAAEWKGPSGQCNMPVPFSNPLPPPGRRFGGSLGSRRFARAVPWELLFAKVSYENLQHLQDKAASLGNRCFFKHLGLSPASGTYCYHAISSLCSFPFIHLLPLLSISMKLCIVNYRGEKPQS